MAWGYGALTLVSLLALAVRAEQPAGPGRATDPVGATAMSPPSKLNSQATPATTAQPRGQYENLINPSGYTSSRVCGTCHVDIYNSWKNSLHAFSLSDPVFDTAYMQAVKEGGDEARRLCLRCHAPLTQANQDYDLKNDVTKEGVSCDFCHTLTAVHLDQPAQPFSMEPGLVKRSVLRKAVSPAHAVVFSELHQSADLCGGCHNFVLPDGTLLMGTYDEWKQGPYARKGVPCQDCHMVRGAGKVVSADIKLTESGEINRHDLIHDTDQLRSALSARVTTAERVPGGVMVRVQVENVGSGHMVPTGIPSREIVLTVAVQAGGNITSQDRRYRKVVADKDGQVLSRDFEILLRGAKILSDNRIAPREQRIESFFFSAPGSGAIKVTATLSYRYSPLIVDQREINIELATAERHVP
jgi:hypothetical protein